MPFLRPELRVCKMARIASRCNDARKHSSRCAQSSEKWMSSLNSTDEAKARRVADLNVTE
jgi:hypothetical protein